MSVLLITPSLVTTTPGGLQVFSASGGSGSGYVFSFLRNNSGGTISSIGHYVAGFGGVIDIVLLVDSLDNSTSAEVTVIGLSEFQGIGLLPQLTTVPAPTPSDAGDFLHTDGFIVTWEPVTTDVLPDQSGHVGQFLTTDGSAASWAVVDALPSQTGHDGEFLTTDGATPSWVPTPSVPGHIYDIRDFGAISQSRTVAHDASAAIAAAILQASADGIVSPAIYIPNGIWICGSPIVMSHPQIALIGDGAQQSILQASTSSTAGDITAFSGPLILGTFALGYTPGYGAALVGSGNSLNIGDHATYVDIYGTTLYLHSAAGWISLTGASQLCVQAWIHPTAFSVGADSGNIIASSGLLTKSFLATCFQMVLHDFGAGLFVTVTLTTSTGIHQFNTPAAGIAFGNTYNLELDYNGSFLDFYIGGVNILHQAVTGTIVQQPWEGVTLGGVIGPGPQSGLLFTDSFNGRLDSVRLSNVARHTGVGSFTPPVAKYTFDSNTLGLFNFDQSLPANLPFVLGQAQNPAASPGTPMTHWAHFQVNNFSSGPKFENIGLRCNGMGEGLIYYGGAIGSIDNVTISGACKVGLGIYTGESYGWGGSNITTVATFNGLGSDLWAFGGSINNLNDQYSPIGCSVSQCIINGMFIQPVQSTCIVPLVIRSSGGFFGPCEIDQVGVDFEGNFNQAIAGVLIDSSVYSMRGTQWVIAATVAGGTGARTVPAVLFDGSPGITVFDGCFFDVESHAGMELIKQQAPDSTLFIRGPVTIKNSSGGLVGAPWSLTPGFVVQDQPQQRNNILGFSTTDTLANNLAGEFTILHGFTSGGPRFVIPEPDGRYIVDINYKGHDGSAPAAGSTVPGPYTTAAIGFTMDQGVDPGGTCQTHWSYTLVRTAGDPLLFSYLPAIPSSFSNPLATVQPTGNWAAGVTIIPTSGDVFAINLTSLQTVIEAGTPSTNWWSMLISSGGYIREDVDSVNNLYSSYVSNGKLGGILNPGPHNIAIAQIHGQTYFYTDGVQIFSGTATAGTQQATIHVGEHAGGSQSLTVATLRNLKVDTDVNQVITYEPDVGPGSVGGAPEAAFFGDQMTTGVFSTSASGGYATQIAQNRYGTTYYWMACKDSATVLGTAGIAKTFWNQWGQSGVTLTGMCLFAGFNDLLLNSSTATDVWTGLKSILEGNASTATWIPPVRNAYAWAGFVPPVSGTATCVIAGVSFNCTIITTYANAVDTLIALIQANGTTNPLVNVTRQPRPGLTVDFYMSTQAKAPGAAGNGITCTSNGANSAYFFTVDGSGVTVGGADIVVTIAGVTFVSNFDTNANTTVNNLIAAVALNGTTGPLVVGTLVSSQMLLTALTPGAAGNDIFVNVTQPLDFFTQLPCGSMWVGQTTLNPIPMIGGYDGAIQQGVPVIVLCNVPPFGNAPGYTVGKNTQRTTLNTTIGTYAAAHGGDGVVLADVDVTLRDAGDHTKIDPTLLSGDNTNPNNAGHTALYGLIEPLLP